MKKIIILLLLPVFMFASFSQDKPKIKGNEKVTTIARIIEEKFNSLEVDDGLKVELIQGMQNSYSVTTDKNLQKVIKFEVSDGVLKINTTSSIISSKKLEIVLTFNNLNHIDLKNNAEVKAKERIISHAMHISAYNSSKFDLDIKADGVAVMMKDNVEGKLKLHSDEITIAISDNAKLDAHISTDQAIVKLEKYAKLALDGKSDKVTFYVSDMSVLDAKKMKVASAKLIVSDNAIVHVDARKNLDLVAKDKCNIYLYSEPEMQVNKLTDSAMISMR